MFSHHSIVSLSTQYLHYYGSKSQCIDPFASNFQSTSNPLSPFRPTVFYLGLSEVSSIFLVIINLAKHFPPTPSSPFHLFVEFVCGPLFVITFFYYRVLLWWKVNALLWSDAFTVVQNGMAEKLRPGKSFVLYLFLACNVPLSILQVYWFGLIVGESAKVVTGVVTAVLNQ